MTRASGRKSTEGAMAGREVSQPPTRTTEQTSEHVGTEPAESDKACVGANTRAQQYKEALRKAYTSQAYLDQRAANLDLLERHGRNAWLIGNWLAEGEARGLEEELRSAREVRRFFS